MRRYRFPLEPVLRVRRIEQDSARAELAAADLELTAAEADLHRSIERYEALPEAGGADAAARWRARRAAVERTAASVVAARGGTEVARSQVEEQRRAVQAARARTRTIERLDERRREEHATEALRAEDAEMDELVTVRHGRDLP